MRRILFASVFCLVAATGFAQTVQTAPGGNSFSGACTEATPNCVIDDAPCRTETPLRDSHETVNQDCFITRYNTGNLAFFVKEKPKTHLCYVVRKEIEGKPPFEIEMLIVQAEECVDQE
jgi:hypothetical protein